MDQNKEHTIPCPKCGKEILDWESTCPYCGARRDMPLREGIRAEESSEFTPPYDPFT